MVRALHSAHQQLSNALSARRRGQHKTALTQVRAKSHKSSSRSLLRLFTLCAKAQSDQVKEVAAKKMCEKETRVSQSVLEVLAFNRYTYY